MQIKSSELSTMVKKIIEEKNSGLEKRRKIAILLGSKGKCRTSIYSVFRIFFKRLHTDMCKLDEILGEEWDIEITLTSKR